MSNRLGSLMAGQLVVALFFSCAWAQEVFRNPAMEANDDSQRAYIRGRQLAERGRFDEAAVELENAAKLKGGKCPECFQMLGQVDLQSGKYREAATAYRHAIDLKPANEAELHNALGVVLFLQHDKALYEPAAAEFRTSISMSQGRLVKAYYNLGHALLKAGQTDEALRVFKDFLDKDPNASEATEVRALIVDPKKAGEPFAPVFTVKTTDGKSLSLEKLKGKVVLLDFWASWCGPCRDDMPEVRKIWKRYGGDRFLIIGVNLDSNERDFRSYAEEEMITWPQYFEGRGWNNTIARLYGVNAIPHSVLIDQDGIIIHRGLRGGRLSNAIGELLKR
jgi:tetratricopeptide (TPR) repeat protein